MFLGAEGLRVMSRSELWVFKETHQNSPLLPSCRPAQVGWRSDVSPWWCRWRVMSRWPNHCPVSWVIGYNQDSSAEVLCDISAARKFVRNAAAAAELQPKNTIYFKGKSEKKTGVPEPTHLFCKIEEIHSVKVELQVSSSPNRTCCFSSNQQKEEKLVSIVH